VTGAGGSGDAARGSDGSLARRSARFTKETAEAGAAALGAAVTRGTATGVRVVRRRISPDSAPPVRPALLDVNSSGGISLPRRRGQNAYAHALVAAQYLIADFVASREHYEERRNRMDRVLARQRDALLEVGIRPDDAARVLVSFGAGLEDADRIGFMVDLYFLDPFAGTGFALLENLWYLMSLDGAGLSLWVVRGFGTAISHGSTTAIFAILSKNLANRELAPWWIAFLPGLSVAIAIRFALQSTSSCTRSSRRRSCSSSCPRWWWSCSG